jgi:hypothetical protein
MDAIAAMARAQSEGRFAPAGALLKKGTDSVIPAEASLPDQKPKALRPTAEATTAPDPAYNRKPADWLGGAGRIANQTAGCGVGLQQTRNDTGNVKLFAS